MNILFNCLKATNQFLNNYSLLCDHIRWALQKSKVFISPLRCMYRISIRICPIGDIFQLLLSLWMSWGQVPSPYLIFCSSLHSKLCKNLGITWNIVQNAQGYSTFLAIHRCCPEKNLNTNIWPCFEHNWSGWTSLKTLKNLADTFSLSFDIIPGS